MLARWLVSSVLTSMTSRIPLADASATRSIDPSLADRPRTRPPAATSQPMRSSRRRDPHRPARMPLVQHRRARPPRTTARSDARRRARAAVAHGPTDSVLDAGRARPARRVRGTTARLASTSDWRHAAADAAACERAGRADVVHRSIVITRHSGGSAYVTRLDDRARYAHRRDRDHLGAGSPRSGCERQHLATRAPRKAMLDVVRDHVAVQAQVIGSAELAIHARVDGLAPRRRPRTPCGATGRWSRPGRCAGRSTSSPSDELPELVGALGTRINWLRPLWLRYFEVTGGGDARPPGRRSATC